MRQNVFFYALLSVINYAIFCQSSRVSIEWKDFCLKMGTLLLDNPDTLEGEFDLSKTMHVCRAKHEKLWTPGALKLNSGPPNCAVSYGQNSYHYKEFQVFHATPGTTSWFPISKKEPIPLTAVHGGTDKNHGNLFVCRTKNLSGDYVFGKLGLYMEEALCYYPAGPKEMTSDTYNEILVINPYRECVNGTANYKEEKIVLFMSTRTREKENSTKPEEMKAVIEETPYNISNSLT